MYDEMRLWQAQCHRKHDILNILHPVTRLFELW